MFYDQRAPNSFVLSCRMEPTLDNEKFYRPSYIASIEPSPRAGPVSVEDLKTDLSSEFSLVSSSSDTSQVRRLYCLDTYFLKHKLSPFIDKNSQNFTGKMKSFFVIF